MRGKLQGNNFLPIITVLFVVIAFFFGVVPDDAADNTLGIWDVITPTTEDSPRQVMTPTVSPSSDAQHTNVQNEPRYRVVKVIDGDTITISMSGKNQTIRLIGINSPESVDPRRAVECFGNEASEKAKEVLAGKHVRIISDPTQADRDRYNRLLRYVYLPDGTLFNKWMISEGYAYEYTYDAPYQLQSEFKEQEALARAQAKGLWSQAACSGTVDTNQEGFVDRDCSDFKTQADAQAFFLSEGGPDNDPHRLDVNKDGAVCEALP